MQPPSDKNAVASHGEEREPHAAHGGPTPKHRKPYEAPRVLKKEMLVASTLISGGDCVFDPPGSC